MTEEISEIKNEELDNVIEDQVVVKEIFESVKLNDEATEEKIKQKRKKKQQETNISTSPVDPTEQLFREFNEFIENKTDMVVDDGIKGTIFTGIDLLDAILGGGFAIGALNMIVGQPGSGKSMLAMQAIGQAQRQFAGTLISAFLDSEEATTTIRLANLGVCYPKIKPYTDITVEKVFKFIEGLCVFKSEKNLIDIPSMVVWDSVANTLSDKERTAEDINSVIGYKARMLSILIPKYVAKLATHNVCLIAVNQMRDSLKMGQFAPAPDLKFMSSSKTVPGGTALKYNAFHLIEMKVGQVLTSDKYGFDGVKTKVKCVKNKLFQPNIEIEILGSFNTGFSNFWTNFNFLSETKRLITGSWNYLVELPEKKFRTRDAEELYMTNLEFRDKYDEISKKAIKEDIIDKYGTPIFNLKTNDENNLEQK